MDKEIAGQPLWLWLAGAGVVVLGYLWFKSHSSSTSQPSGSSGQAQPSKSTSSFRETITDLQSAPTPSTKKKKPTAG